MMDNLKTKTFATPEKAARGKAKNGKTNITTYGLTLNLASTQLDYIVDMYLDTINSEITVCYGKASISE